MILLQDLKKLGSVSDLTAGTSLDAAELETAVLSRAGFLREKGLGPGHFVLITHGGTPFFFADLLALWQVGAAAACLNPTLTPGEVKTIAEFVGPAAILRGPGELPRGLPGIKDFDLETEAAIPPPFEAPDQIPPDSPALILFTSGTTGNPKGVVHTFGSIAARLQNNWAFLPTETLSKTLCVLPTHFGHGLIGNCLTPLLAGCDLFLFAKPGIAGAAALGQVIDQNRITFLSSVPSFWKVVLKASKKPSAQTLKQVSIGSAPLTAELWQRVQDWAGIKNVCNMYGITETANWAAGVSGAGTAITDGLVGRMWGGEAGVRNEDGVISKTGVGEIVLKTPSAMKGYLKRPDLTAEVLADGWYRTGDWGEVDKDGVIKLLGRTKTEINKAGIKILPEEIDMLLEKHPGVHEACAFGVPDPISGETVAVALVLKPGAEAKVPDYRDWCRARIKPDGVPEKWFFLSEIPKTDRGKINRGVVRDYCVKEGEKA